jgi:hypothetical protein
VAPGKHVGFEQAKGRHPGRDAEDRDRRVVHRDIIVDPRPPAERWPRKGVTKIKAVLQQGAL